MYGAVTRNAEEAEWPEFDRAFYEVKDVTGRAAEPVSGAVNLVACFADNAAAESDPELVAVDDAGRSATADHEAFDWTHVCPTHPDYRAGLLEIVEDCAAVSGDVRLDDVGYPRPGFCRCERCDRRFAQSEYEDRDAWRTAVLTEFVADAAERVPGDLYLSLYPDPYPGHLRERAGLDPDALAEHVDEFVVSLYDPGYETTYWLESIASGFADELDQPFGVELYAVEQDIDALIAASEAVDPYADHVYFGFDASTAAAAIRRKGADAREGVSYGPE
ncbi:MAG: hypothetical protein ABEJ74_07845 [Haloferacaceae archaeon]